MEDARIYYKQFSMDEEGFSQIRVFDQRRVKQEHQMRKDLEFFPFTKEQILKAGEPGYIERNESYLQFVHFLTENFEISLKEADEIVEECLYATNIGEQPGQIMQFLQSRFTFDSLETINAFMEQVVYLMNNSRQWFLKGYSPTELGAYERQKLNPLPQRKKNVIDFATGKKVGRNDPCPCGSNKKYKNCCGR